MEKKNRDFISFLQDESFKKWVFQPDQESNLYWQEYVKVHPGERNAIRKARQVMLSMRFQEFPESESDEKYEVFRNIIKGNRTPRGINIEKAQLSQRKTRKVSFYWSVAATVLLLLGFAFYFWFSSQNITKLPNEVATVVKQNPKGRKSFITLPDGTRVKLNADSKISYPERFDSLKREVYLAGEAYFEVEKDTQRPFSVIASDLVTTALGTSFNIKAWQDDSLIQVALAEGKVKVEKLDAVEEDNYFLNPGQKIIHHAYTETFQVASFDPMLEFGWKDGVIIFQRASLDEFVHRISRWYGVGFDIQGYPDQPWSIDGRFENESLEEILESLSFTYKIDYQLKEDKVILTL